MSIYKKIKLKIFNLIMNLMFMMRERYKHISINAVISKDVKRALVDIDISRITIEESRRFKDKIDTHVMITNLPQHKDIFYFKNFPLPCVLELDYSAKDKWLTDENYYPLYFNLYKILTSNMERVRMLEIGVRTGYQGVVFAKACEHKTVAFFTGLDPNIYLENGLSLAGESLKILRNNCTNFDFVLYEGYSWEQSIQRSLLHSGPYDIIHIDGDHSLQGKLVDLELSRRLLAHDGIVLVDDYDHHVIIKDAIKRAIVAGWFKEFLYIKTLHGLAILR